MAVPQKLGIELPCVCVCLCVCSIAQLCSTLKSHGLGPTRLLCPWNFPGKNIGMGCHFFLHGITIRSSNSISRYIFKELKAGIRIDIYIPMFRAALFIMAKANQVSPTDERINKMQYIHIMEYYPTVKRKEVMTYATWMNLKDIKWYMLITEKQTAWSHLYLVCKVTKLTETESRIVSARACRKADIPHPWHFTRNRHYWSMQGDLPFLKHLFLLFARKWESESIKVT